MDQIKSTLETHLQQKVCNRKWLSPLLDRQPDTVKATDFPYQIQKNGQAFLQGMHIVPSQVQINFPLTNGAQGKPVYVINIPWGPTKRSYEELMTLIQEQAFRTSAIESRQEANCRLGVVVGMNQAESLDREINTRFSERIQSVSPVDLPVRVFGFLWSPTWEKNVNQPLLYENKKCFLLLKLLSRDVALALRPLLETLASEQVPYGQIRERIKNSEETLGFVQYFRRNAEASPLYLMTLDSDVLEMRTAGDGAFSYLDREIQFSPDILTTGYRAPSSASGLMRLSVKVDMAVRWGMAQVIGNACYYPEPFFGFRLPSHLQPSNFSFLGKESKLESRRLIQNGIKAGYINPNKMRFLRDGALATAVDRFSTDKVNKITTVTKKNILEKQVLTAIHGIGQTHAFAKQWADNLYLALPKTKAKRVTDVTTHLMTIYTVFDPTKVISGFITSVLKQQHSTNAAGIIFPQYQRVACLLVRSHQFTPNQGLEEIKKLANALYSDRDKKYDDYVTFLTTLREKLLSAGNSLLNLGLDPVWTQKVIKAACVSGDALYKVLKEIYEEK
ncbi:MAG: hypothetical protein JSR80_01655 [Verrucomicrobia bacterium]|nr:hypothetical protein [Verrucomicrobiota bacterium]